MSLNQLGIVPQQAMLELEGGATEGIIAEFSDSPNELRLRQIDRIVSRLERVGIWQKLDGLWVFTQSNEADAQINWKDPSGAKASNTGATFLADWGYTTDGVNDFVNLNWNPSIDRTNFARNNAIFGVWYYPDISRNGSSAGWFDGSDGITLRPKGTGGFGFAARVNSAGSLDRSFTGDATGLYVGERTSSTAVRNYRNGVKLGLDGAIASTAINNANLRLGNAVSGAFVDYTFRVALVGASLTADQHAELYNTLRNYLEPIVIGD